MDSGPWSHPYLIHLLNLLLAALLIALNGVFVAAEFAFVRVRPTRIHQLDREGSLRARVARFGIEHLDAYLSVSQLGITLASLGLGWLGEPAVSSLLRPVFRFFGITSGARSISVLVGFALITFLHVVFGELAPKTISIQRCEKVALALAIPMRLFYILFLPFVFLLNGSANLVVRLAGLSRQTDEGHSLEELRMLVEDSLQEEPEAEPGEETGADKEQSEKQMLRKVFYFEKKDARDIMVPRLDTHCLQIEASDEENLKFIARTKHTRYPVLAEEDGRVKGILNIKDLVGADKPLAELLTEPMYVSENISLDRLLDKMQHQSQQLAVVVDEYGLFQGIVSSEDVVEELVGDLKDEYDGDEEIMIHHPAEGLWHVSGKLSFTELAELLSISYPAEEKDVATVAGFVLEQKGSIPSPGDAFVYEDYRFCVTAMDGQRILKVTVTRLDRKKE
ncbi:MAG: HlyC/CorC family transporter [Abditibacteriota bacterium]|nr:HlyC/CorC family transporter [Abditibacteriota bacterium]